MTDFNYVNYGQRRNAATGSYGARAAQNAYAQFLSQQRGSRKKFQFGEQTEKMAPKVVSSFTQRGLAGPGVRSGVYERGLTDFAKQRFEGLSDINRQFDEEAQQLKLDDAQNIADYNQQIAQLEAEKQASIAQAAATLSAFKPFLGG
jgi:hypothetical protein